MQKSPAEYSSSQVSGYSNSDRKRGKSNKEPHSLSITDFTVRIKERSGTRKDNNYIDNSKVTLNGKQPYYIKNKS